MTRRISEDVINEAKRMRIKERRSLADIAGALGIGKSTASKILRSHPLSPEELRSFRVANAAKARASRSGRTAKDVRVGATSYRFVPSTYASLSTDQKGAIAEAACVLRLKQHGLVPYLPLCQGGRVDIVAFVPTTGRFWRIQVKTAAVGKWGNASAPLRAKSNGKRRRYDPDAFDFLIAYEPPTEACYVLAAHEIAEIACTVSVNETSLEAWSKLL